MSTTREHQDMRGRLVAEVASLEELATELGQIPDARERLVLFAEKIIERYGACAPAPEDPALVSPPRCPAAAPTPLGSEVGIPKITAMTEEGAEKFKQVVVPSGPLRGRTIGELTTLELVRLARPDNFRARVWSYLVYLEGE